MSLTTYTLSASVIDSNGVRIGATQPEVLGEYYGQTYLSAEAAESAREDAEELAREYYESAEVTIERETVSGQAAIDLIEEHSFSSRDEARAAIRRVDGENAIIAANWAQAASPIMVSWCRDNNDWDSTQYQVASFRHVSADAAEAIDEDDVTWVLSVSHDGSARAERLSR